MQCCWCTSIATQWLSMMVFCSWYVLKRCGCCCVIGAVVLNDTLDWSGRLLLYSRDWLVVLICCFWHGFSGSLLILFSINKDGVILWDKNGSFLSNCDWISDVGDTYCWHIFLLWQRTVINLSAQLEMTFLVLFEVLFCSCSLISDDLISADLVVEILDGLVVKILVIKGFVFRSIPLFVFGNGMTRLGGLLERIGLNISNFY